MPSPFPGMDPYLEASNLWASFQHHLVTCLYQSLLPGLVDRYRARVGQRVYYTEQPLFTSVVREEHHEDYIEIRQRSDGRLITLLDFVSPTNKTTEAGKQAYLEKRREGRGQGANLVEIDLVLQGQPMLEYSREGLPDWDYAVAVTRATQPDRFEIYTAVLQKRLPRFSMPLASDEQNTGVGLQTMLTRAYEQGAFGSQIDYRRNPDVHLNDEDLSWVNEVLKQHGLR
jgi:hypothetical protein